MTSLVVQLHPDTPVMQTASEAAVTLGIGRDTLRGYMHRRRDPIPWSYIGDGRRVKKINIPRAIEWLDKI
jgi:hypothetical protein